MAALRILGYADMKPAVFAVDRASPESRVSAAFVFHNSLNTCLNSAGINHVRLSLKVPSRGGYYTSSNLLVVSSAAHAADVLLGADWLAPCRATMGANILQQPAEESIEALPEGYSWVADGVL